MCGCFVEILFTETVSVTEKKGWPTIRLKMLFCTLALRKGAFPSSPRRLFSTAKRLPSAIYRERIECGEVQDDPAQQEILHHMDQLFTSVVEFEPQAKTWAPSQKSEPTEEGWFSSLKNTFALGTESGSTAPEKPTIVPAPRGLYIHGGPGSGKTFLMDLFHEALPFEGSRRLHFHEFMMEVHRILHDLQRRNVTGKEMMDQCVYNLRSKAWILCFDEFQVTDVADAMVMRRLFSSLFENGLVMVATSNREPDELYKDGMQRDLFVPFIEELKVKSRVINIQSNVDYRLLTALRGTSSSTNGNDSTDNSLFIHVKDNKSIKQIARFERLWDDLSKGDVVNDLSLRVQGRTVPIPAAGRHADVGRFTFDELCTEALGSADYYAIAATFHTVFIEDLPRLSLSQGHVNRVRRLITLIDTFYDQGVVTVISSQVPMEEILDTTGGAQIQETDILGTSNYVPKNVDEIFAFARTLSRLQEMQTAEYLERASKYRQNQVSAFRFYSQLERSSKISDGDIRQVFDRYDANDDGTLDIDKDLVEFLQEIQLFTAGHRHVPDDLLHETIKILDPRGSGKVSWESFLAFVRERGLTGIR